MLAAATLDAEGWSLLAEGVEALEDSWRTTGAGDLARFVPPCSHALRGRVLVELIKVDQELRWASGERKPLEAYLVDWPELAGDTEAVRELLEAECLTRAALASVPTAEELQTRFPAISAGIDLTAVAAQAAGEKTHGHDPLAAFVDTSKDAVSTWSVPATSDAAPQLAVGQLLGPGGRYEIRALLGQGGMGAVYRAYDTRLQREVALKIPRISPVAEPAVLKRFLREARAAARIRHPNICPIFDVGQFQGGSYLTMALIEGQSLAQWQQNRQIDPRHAAELVRKLAQALAAVHAERIVHRDIKPSNVMIDRTGEPLLTDFGLARLGEEELAAAESTVGWDQRSAVPPEVPAESAKTDGGTALR